MVDATILHKRIVYFWSVIIMDFRAFTEYIVA